MHGRAKMSCAIQAYAKPWRRSISPAHSDQLARTPFYILARVPDPPFPVGPP
jgi:hypothetical protein